ncbi:hypothetical protein FRC09_020999 [Ceratobasidium sp. 395]|nr:hypothetical protein FRC09_020999 [Ceratobasidium sp. 395]
MSLGSPTSLVMDTQVLFSSRASPLFRSENSVPPVHPAGIDHRSVSDPAPKRVQPIRHRKNLNPELLLPVDAPTQTRNYYGPTAISHEVLPAGFEERRAKIVAKRRRGVETVTKMTEEGILNSVSELEHVKKLEDEFATANEAMKL